MNEGDTPVRCSLGALVIDLQRSSVRGHASPSDLTPRAEALLLLARNANEVVSPDDILRTVWAGRVVEEAVISHCVWQIRKALGPQGKHILQNRTKRGYMLVVPPEAWVRDHDAPGRATGHGPEPVSDQSSVPARTPPGAEPSSPDPETPTPTPASASASASAQAATPEAPPEDGAPSAPAGHAPVGEAEAGPSVPSPDDASSPGAGPRGARHHRRRWAAAALAALVVAGLWWGWSRSGFAPMEAIALDPAEDMTVSVVVPDGAAWLRPAVLAVVVEEGYARGGSVLLFEKPQTRNPFAGPHLQLRLETRPGGRVEGELRLRHGGREVREPVSAASGDLPSLTRRFLRAHLQPAQVKVGAAFDEFVLGRVAHLERDTQRALLHYERALARDPAMAEAALAMAELNADLGRTRMALEMLEGLRAPRMRGRLDATQRCRLEMVVADIDPARIGADLCGAAQRRAFEKDRDYRRVLRALEGRSGDRLGAARWLEDEQAAIRAHIGVRDFRRAEDRIAQVEQIAGEAGWEYARVLMLVYRGTIASQEGRGAETARLDRAAIEGFEATHDVDMALFVRLNVITATQLVPGPQFEARRWELRRIVDRAQSIGSVTSEIDALRELLEIDQDRPQAWTAHMNRIRELARKELAAKNRLQLELYLFRPMFQQRRYAEAIAGIEALRRAGATFSEATMLTQGALATARFRRDELPLAAAAVEAMRKENFDMGYTGTCRYAWLFAELDRPDRFALMLEACPFRTHDSAMRAEYSDLGLLATTRSHMRAGRPEQAWAELRPRIDALLALPAPSREEAAMLAALATHATAAPQADPQRLARALAKVEPMVALDGAGPTLRFNVHTLRWRLCMADRRSDCGPALPKWAPEDRFEARLAEEYAAALAARR